jgi:hypothetical protein
MRQTSYRGFLKKDERKLARSFNFTFRYIDALLSLHNTTCSDCVDHIEPIYSFEIEIKGTTDTAETASCPDLHLDIDSEDWLRT